MFYKLFNESTKFHHNSIIELAWKIGATTDWALL